MTWTDLEAFGDLLRMERQKNPFILSRIWHIRTDDGNGILCGTWGQCWTSGDMDSVTASGIPVCRSCQRSANADLPIGPEAMYR